MTGNPAIVDDKWILEYPQLQLIYDWKPHYREYLTPCERSQSWHHQHHIPITPTLQPRSHQHTSDRVRASHTAYSDRDANYSGIFPPLGSPQFPHEPSDRDRVPADFHPRQLSPHQQPQLSPQQAPHQHFPHLSPTRSIAPSSVDVIENLFPLGD